MGEKADESFFDGREWQPEEYFWNHSMMLKR
jgi:hypothetical protein